MMKDFKTMFANVRKPLIVDVNGKYYGEYFNINDIFKDAESIVYFGGVVTVYKFGTLGRIEPYYKDNTALSINQNNIDYLKKYFHFNY